MAVSLRNDRSVAATALSFTQAIEGEAPSILARILEPSTPLAIWRRKLSSSMQVAADAACAAPIEYASAFRPFEVAEEERFRADLAAVSHASLDPIADDLIVLAHLFADICGITSVRLRLETVADDGCRRFHYDNVAMRLVVAYRGAGAQWVPHEFAADAYDQQTNYKGPLNEIRIGDVALFRGRRSNNAFMTLHRSPPSRGDASVRLVGVIDYVDW